MDDDTTIKIARPQHVPVIPSEPPEPSDDMLDKQPVPVQTDEPTVKLEPVHVAPTNGNGAAHPVEYADIADAPTLEYEQTWDDEAATNEADKTNEPEATSLASETPVALATPVKPALQTAPPVPTIPAPVKTRRQRKRWPRWAKITAAVFLVLLLLTGGAAGYGYYYFNTNVQQPLQKIIRTVNRGKIEQHLKTQPLPPDTAVTGRSWNILLLGSDNDQKYTFPVILTQVMMVVHIDTVQNTVTMVSIPRDSWVNVPEIGGMHKIDQAFFLGALQHNNFNDGLRVAREAIEQDYGITIDRYAWVGLAGFANVINTLGGVDVDVTHPIMDDNYPDDTGKNANNPYSLKRLNLSPGPQHLDGQQALEYVRSRHADLVGDIGRTVRQQQVLEALKLKLNVMSVLNNLHSLIADLTGNVYTDLTEQEMIGFAIYGHGLSNNAISHLTLGPGPGAQDYGDFGTVYDPSVGSQQDIVIPHCQNIQPIINRVFGLGNAHSCNVNG